jgi:hypothetical protein
VVPGNGAIAPHSYNFSIPGHGVTARLVAELPAPTRALSPGDVQTGLSRFYHSMALDNFIIPSSKVTFMIQIEHVSDNLIVGLMCLQNAVQLTKFTPD